MTSEEIQNKIDAATSAITISNCIDRYAELQRIKYSPNREKEIEHALRVREEILKLWDVDINKLREAGKNLYKEETDMES